MDAHVILNPSAGQTASNVGLDRALDVLTGHGWALTVRESQARGDVTRLAAAAAGVNDPSLAALYFQFGRYLIVSGGRENSSAGRISSSAASLSAVS